jgi:alcohol dehydrogenase class IV
MNGTRLVFAPQSYVGRGAVVHLLAEVKKHAASRVLLISDPVLVQLGITNRILDIMRAANCHVDVFAEVIPEPSLELAEELVEYTRKGEYDLVVGLGGGSALDLAKLAAVLSAHEGAVAEYLNLTGSRKIEYKGLSKVLIPTTSGTGSEVTNIAVLSLEKTKDVVVHDYLLPDAAIVDSDLTLSLPPHVTAATGMDALTHAIEAYLSVLACPVTDALALHAVQLAGRSLERAVHDGACIEAREDLSQASFLAGLAFFNAGVAGVHALAYPLGGQFHISHGAANAVILPYVMAYIRPGCKRRMRDLLYALDGHSSDLSEDDASLRFVERLHHLIERIHLPRTLSDYEITEENLEQLTQDACRQQRLLSRSPLPLAYKDIFLIYEAAYYGHFQQTQQTQQTNET